MMRSLKTMEQYKVKATDGDVGNVVNFLLDDDRWTVRYLVVDAGNFLTGRRVLISPISFGEVEWDTKQFDVRLTKDRIKNSPSVSTDEPVSRQREQEYSGYYDYPPYWGAAGVWGGGAYPGALAEGRFGEPGSGYSAGPSGDVHLRSANEVVGYHIEGTDGAIGHVNDFIVDDKSWQVRYLVVDTTNWWAGKKVLVAPDWSTSVSWFDRKVYLDLSREMIKKSPEWDGSAFLSRTYEESLYGYYGRPSYWGRPSRLPDGKSTRLHEHSSR